MTRILPRRRPCSSTWGECEAQLQSAERTVEVHMRCAYCSLYSSLPRMTPRWSQEDTGLSLQDRRRRHA